jgi:hypothetical protein
MGKTTVSTMQSYLLCLLHFLLLLTEIRNTFIRFLSFESNRIESNIISSIYTYTYIYIHTHRRNNFKDGKLTYHKILLLNELDFVWNRIESAWYEKYGQLCRYQEKYGHCNVASILDRTLAEWTQRQ